MGFGFLLFPTLYAMPYCIDHAVLAHGILYLFALLPIRSTIATALPISVLTSIAIIVLVQMHYIVSE